MKTAIIRSFDRDDQSAHMCYLTMKKHSVADRYIFFHDKDNPNHPLIKSTGEEIFYHEGCGNYGGLVYVKVMLTELAKLKKSEDSDYIIFSDSDIAFIKNPFDLIDESIDHAGIYGKAEVCPHIPHVSGQLNIIKGWLWNKWIETPENAEEAYKYQSTSAYISGTADDTLFSIFAYLNKAKQFSFEGLNYWVHNKINNQREYNEFSDKYLR